MKRKTIPKVRYRYAPQKKPAVLHDQATPGSPKCIMHAVHLHCQALPLLHCRKACQWLAKHIPKGLGSVRGADMRNSTAQWALEQHHTQGGSAVETKVFLVPPGIQVAIRGAGLKMFERLGFQRDGNEEV